jgi:hypothetical protein
MMTTIPILYDYHRYAVRYNDEEIDKRNYILSDSMLRNYSYIFKENDKIDVSNLCYDVNVYFSSS